MRVHIAAIIAERTGLADHALADKTDFAIIWLTEAASFGTIKRVSYAVGHQDLAATYEKVVTMDGNLSNRVIDVAIKLDHYENLPEQELRKLQSLVLKNPFTFSLIRDLVGDHLYLYGCDYPNYADARLRLEHQNNHTPIRAQPRQENLVLSPRPASPHDLRNSPTTEPGPRARGARPWGEHARGSGAGRALECGKRVAGRFSGDCGLSSWIPSLKVRKCKPL
jgi:hypothetical protein